MKKKRRRTYISSKRKIKKKTLVYVPGKNISLFVLLLIALEVVNSSPFQQREVIPDDGIYPLLI